MITSPADTLVCDTTQLAVWQSDPAYDYGRELMAPDINVFESVSYTHLTLPTNREV